MAGRTTPHGGIKWLKRLKQALDVDDDDSSDAATPSKLRRRPQRSVGSREGEKKPRGVKEEAMAVAVSQEMQPPKEDSEREQQRRRGSRERANKEREDPREAARRQRRHRRPRQEEEADSDGDDASPRPIKRENTMEEELRHLERRKRLRRGAGDVDAVKRRRKTRVTPVAESDEADGDKEDEGDGGERQQQRQQRLEERRRASSPARPKRPHAESGSEKEGGRVRHAAVSTKVELPVDPKKAEAAVMRQRRKRKLQRRREATGEAAKLSAIKTQRQQAFALAKEAELLRKRVPRVGMASPVAVTTGVDIKGQIPSSLDTREKRNSKKRLQHAAAKAALAAGTDEKAAPARPMSADRRKTQVKRRKDEATSASPSGSVERRHSLRGKKDELDVRERKKRKLERQRAVLASGVEKDELSTAVAKGTTTVRSPENEVVIKEGPVGTLNSDTRTDQNGEKTDDSGKEGSEAADKKVTTVETTAEAKCDIDEESRVVGGNASTEVGDGASEIKQEAIKLSDKVESEAVKLEDEVPPGQNLLEKTKVAVERSVQEQTEDKEEGLVEAPEVADRISATEEKAQEGDVKKPEMKEETPLDMLPIPRKAPTAGGDPASSSDALSFVIPKKSFAKQRGDHPQAPGAIRVGLGGARGGKSPLGAPSSLGTKPLASSGPPMQLPNQVLVRPQRKRTKNPVPVQSAIYSQQERSFMRLARKRNSIFTAAAELAAQVSDTGGGRKLTASAVRGYEVYDDDGKLLADLIPRLSCVSKSEMTAHREAYSASFFGVSLAAPKAKVKASETADMSTISETDSRSMNCYEELRFKEANDREFYQRKMYGTTFVPQLLRGRTTLIARNAIFERKSTGIRFNQDRDRDEFADSLSKRYTFKNSVPRCDISRENWQMLMKKRPASVYLHYYNREDAEHASHIFRDDLGNPLELKREYKAGVVLSRSPSPAAAARSHRTPRRSLSSERSAPEPSPLSQNDSSRNTPLWRRERQPPPRNEPRRPMYDRGAPPPPPRRSGGGGRYGPFGNGGEQPRVPLRSRSRSKSRSRSRSRSKSLHGRQSDLSTGRTTGGAEVTKPEADSLPADSKKDANEGPKAEIDEQHPADVNTGSSAVDQQVSNGNGKDGSNMKTPAQKQVTVWSPPPSPLLSAAVALAKATNIEGEREQEPKGEGEIEMESSAVAASTNGDNRRDQRSPPPSPFRQQQNHPSDVQEPPWPEDYPDNHYDRSRRPDSDYRAYQQQVDQRPDRRRSRSPRSGPSPPRGGRGDAWGRPYREERQHSRDFQPSVVYDDGGRGRGAYPDDMDRRGGYNHRDRGDYDDGGGRFPSHRGRGPRAAERNRRYY